MSGIGAHELEAKARTSPGRNARRPPHGSDPYAIIRSRAHTQQQAEACARFLRYAARCAPNGGRVDRTWKQLAKGLGKDVDGMTQREARDRYRGSIRNTIGYLLAWGLLEGFETLYEANGEGRCIVFSLSAGVAQSVRAAES